MVHGRVLHDRSLGWTGDSAFPPSAWPKSQQNPTTRNAKANKATWLGSRFQCCGRICESSTRGPRNILRGIRGLPGDGQNRRMSNEPTSGIMRRWSHMRNKTHILVLSPGKYPQLNMRCSITELRDPAVKTETLTLSGFWALPK